MYEKLKKAAEAATQGPWYEQDDEDSAAGAVFIMPESATYAAPICRITVEANAAFIAAANPSAVLALIAENEQQARIIASIDKHLRGVVNDPDPLPPIMPGAIGIETTYGLVAGIRRERDYLKAESNAAQNAYLAAGEREHSLRVERENLRKAVTYAVEMFSRISSGDGSGHADLAHAVLRIAGDAMGKDVFQ